MDFGDLAQRLEGVRDTVARNQAVGGWTHPVEVVAITKGFTVEAVGAAVAAGIRAVGENRVQEALEKMDAAAARGVTAEWHLVGHLQRNKAKFVPGRFAVVHSVDSVDLAQEL